MTITNENFKNVYVLNSSTTAFPYTFKIFDDTDLLVKRYDSTTGVFTTLTLTTDYTVSGAGDAAGGTVTYSGASAYDSDYQLVITSDIANTQDTDLLNNDYSADFNETLEETFDRLCRMIQQLKEVVDRSVVLNATETTGATFPSASANALIGWNSGATALENKTMMDANAQAAAEAAAASAEEDAATAEQAAIDAVIAKEAAELIADLEVASEADAQAGTDNDKMMTPLRTFQGVAAYAAANFLTTPEEAPDADYEVANVKYVVDSVEYKTGLGSWTDKSSSYGAQQSTVEAEIIVLSSGGDANGTIKGYSDSSSNPTTVRGQTTNSFANAVSSFRFPVKAGDYWKVVVSGSITLDAVYLITRT